MDLEALVICVFCLLYLSYNNCLAREGWIVTGALDTSKTSTPPCEELCVSILGLLSGSIVAGNQVNVAPCFDISTPYKKQRWTYLNNTITVASNRNGDKLCMSATDTGDVVLDECKPGTKGQYWSIDDDTRRIMNHEKLYLQGAKLSYHLLKLSSTPTPSLQAFTFLDLRSLEYDHSTSTVLANGNFNRVSPYVESGIIRKSWAYAVCNWTVDSITYGVEIVKHAGCPGDHALDLKGSGSISQTVALDSGYDYQVVFYHAQSTNKSCSISGRSNGTVMITQAEPLSVSTGEYTSSASTACLEKRIIFQAVGRSAKLTIQALSIDPACGPVISNVQVLKYNNNTRPFNSQPGTSTNDRADRVDRVKVIAIASSAAITSLLLIAITLWYLNKWRRRNIEEETLLLPGALKRYSIHEVRRMSGNFAHCIGEGGDATVYLATDSTGRKCVVKRFKKDSTLELALLGRVHHRCIVECYGYCIDGGEMFTILEYMARGSLSNALHKNEEVLSWESRVAIARDVASGLCYLHHGAEPPIIHRDIKPANVLLGEDLLSAKVADFGISKHGLRTTETYHFRGTPGYMDPVCVKLGILSGKADVYSYGVLLLELISGRAPDVDLLEFATDQEVESLADPRLEGLYDVEEFKHFRDVAIMCMSDWKTRPTMTTIWDMVKEQND